MFFAFFTSKPLSQTYHHHHGKKVKVDTQSLEAHPILVNSNKWRGYCKLLKNHNKKELM